MNHLQTILLILFFAPFVLTAQSPDESNRAMTQGTHNAFMYAVEGLEDKEMEDVLKNYLKDFKSRRNPKYSRRDNEFFVDDMELNAVSSNTIDVYAQIESRGDLKHDIIVWFDMGGAYLNSQDHAEAARYLEETWFPGLSTMSYNRMVEIELEAEEDKLKDLNKDFDRLQREQKKLEDDIEDYKQKVKKAEQDLKDNIAAQQEMEKVIKEQQEVVKSVGKKKKN